MKQPYFVLGAEDPEMSRIEDLLLGTEYPVVHAESQNGRVNSGNAYRATNCGVPADAPFVAVECSIKGREPSVLVDHHRQGDPGHGVDPARFLEGSSIGQVISFLSKNYSLPAKWAIRMVKAVSGAPLAERGAFLFNSDQWLVLSPLGWLEVPNDFVLAAAADHCLAAAFAGQCPGVNRQELIDWRARTRAEFQRRSVDEIEQAVAAAKAKLEEAKEVPGLPGTKDMRPFGFVPELPEAAAQEGVAILSEVESPDGRRKVVLLSAGRNQLTAWPTWAKKNGLVDLYGGDPARGFAGGYVSD